MLATIKNGRKKDSICHFTTWIFNFLRPEQRQMVLTWTMSQHLVVGAGEEEGSEESFAIEGSKIHVANALMVRGTPGNGKENAQAKKFWTANFTSTYLQQVRIGHCGKGWVWHQWNIFGCHSAAKNTMLRCLRGADYLPYKLNTGLRIKTCKHQLQVIVVPILKTHSQVKNINIGKWMYLDPPFQPPPVYRPAAPSCQLRGLRCSGKRCKALKKTWKHRENFSCMQNGRYTTNQY